MTRGPTRLKNDPDFQWETGCNVADEELVVGAYDHAALRARIVAAAALAGGAAATTTAAVIGDGVPAVARAAGWTFAAGWKPVAVATLGAAMLAGAAYWLGVQSVPVAAQDGGVHLPAAARMAPPAIVEPTSPSPVAAPREEVIAPPAASLRVAPPRELAPSPVVDVPAIDATITTDPSPAVAELPTSPASRLNEQNQVMGIAADALEDGNFVRAEQMYERYLAEWPSGPSAPDATYGLMQARFGRGDAAGAEALAKKMQDDPAFSEKREEILRFRAESLVQLGRCGEALLLVEKLSARDAAPVRRACRR
jgi:hypothetical protein